MMNKNELIRELEKIPGNPTMVLKTGEEQWEEIKSISGTGLHRSAISFLTDNYKDISWLGPVP